MPRAARKWTQEEDDLLSKEVNSQLTGGKVRDWTVIADKIAGRTNKDCRKRWHNALSGSFNKGYWTAEEDKLLARAVQTHGELWTAVAEVVTMRSADQCAKRWKQCLDPQLDRSEWTEEENRRLMEVEAVKGRRWKEIQIEHFPSRSRNSIKNQYTILARRESRLQKGRTRNARPKQTKSTSRENAPLSDVSSYDEDDDTDDDEDSSLEEDGDSGQLGVFDPRSNQTISSSTFNSNPAFETPEKIAMHMGQDSSWVNLPADFANHAWDTTLPSIGDTEMHGVLPDLPAVSPDVLQGLGCNCSDPAKHRFHPDILQSSPTNISDYFSLGDLDMAGVEPYQPADISFLGTGIDCRGNQSSKVVLTVEGADHRVVESLMQVAISSGSRFHLARE